MNKNIVIKTLHTNKDKIKECGVKKLSLFGSYAKGKQKKNSDIDFIVVFKKNRGNFKDYISLKHLLEDLFNRRIDLAKEKLLFKEIKKGIMESKIEAKL